VPPDELVWWTGNGRYPREGFSPADEAPSHHSRYAYLTVMPMDQRFLRAIDFVLAHEGGYVNHAKDPGGATNLGITRATLESWRGRPVTAEDVKALHRNEALAIYKARYWEPACCEALPAPLALIHFDTAVNCGIGAAARLLQQSASVRVDGQIGPKTLAAVSRANLPELLTEYTARRLVRYAGLSTFDTFGLGWSRRAAEALRVALSYATAEV